MRLGSQCLLVTDRLTEKFKSFQFMQHKKCKELYIIFQINYGLPPCSGGQTHLGTYFFTQLQARRIQTFLRKSLSNFRPHLTFKLYKFFWRRIFCFRSYWWLTNPHPPFPFPLSLGTLHQDAYHTCKRCISPMSPAKKSLSTS